MIGLLAAAQAVAQDTNDNSSAELKNWVTIGAGSTFVGGDKAQFMHEKQIPSGPFGGIEDFHWEKFIGKKGFLSVDGHGIFDNHDYSLRLSLSDPDKGYVRAGYTEFRTWYDGNGGFFPHNDLWFSTRAANGYGNELHVDRGQAWFEAGLTLPDKPVISFRYEHDFRHGEKDSTEWGDSNLTGGLGTRNIVPTFMGIDETRDIFQVDLKHTVDKTDFGVGVRYELDRNDDTLNIHRRPGESADRFVTQEDVLNDDLFNAHAFTATHFNERVVLTLGGSFTTLDTDTSGSRIYGSGYDAVYDPNYANAQRFDEGFLNLQGGANTKQYVGNVNLMLTPWDSFTIVPSLRIEHENTDGSANFIDTTVNPALPVTETPTDYVGDNWFLDVAESLEARYTGVTNWTFYAMGEWSETEGNETEREVIAPAAPVENTDWRRFTQKYSVGANWYPLSRLNFSGQYYHKIHEYDYDNRLTASPTGYPGFLDDQNFKTDDMNVRATWRPLGTLLLVTRYDFQLSTVETSAGSLNSVESAETTTHIVSESIGWTPWSRLYVQANGSYVLESVDTPAANLPGITNLVLNFPSDYWDANVMAGFAINDKTDLQLQYSYYRADDFVNNSTFSQPYGAGFEQQNVTATLNRQISKAVRASLKYGFYHNHNETSGGHNDYDAHLLFATIEYRF